MLQSVGLQRVKHNRATELKHKLSYDVQIDESSQTPKTMFFPFSVSNPSKFTTTLISKVTN